MIDTMNEQVVTFHDAPDFVPKRPSGKRVHKATLYRWGLTGCKGIILETVQCGGSLCTSKEALARFFERLTSIRTGDTAPRTPLARTREASKAEQELAAAGY